MPGAHALLSASGAKRWMSCTPSARLEEQFPESRSAYADEGTLAHSIGELMLRKRFLGMGPRAHKSALDKLQADPLYTPDMAEHVRIYTDYVEERYNAARLLCKDPLITIEQRLDLTTWVPEAFGTGDVVIVAEGTLEIIDLKYGKGVPVSAEENPQLRLYGLGAWDAFAMLYDIGRVRMTIVQPRLDSISVEEMSAEDLTCWADEFVMPRAELAIKGEGEFVPGDHCRFCRAKETCRARADAARAAVVEDFALPPLLSDEEVTRILDKADLIRSWIDDITGYALTAAENGTRFEGWKLVEGRAVRRYSNEDDVLARLKFNGFEEAIITKRSLLGLTEMEKTLGKKPFSEILGELIVKPTGKPVLVRATDKRPEIQSAATAESVFTGGAE